jgi:hypothetical protein
MALSAPGWAGGFVGLLRFVMAAFAVLMKSLFYRRSLSFGLCLMTIDTQFARGLAFLPGMVTFQAIDLQRFGMLLMSEGYFPIRRIQFNLTPFLSKSICPLLNSLDRRSLTNIHFLSRKKIRRAMSENLDLL